METSTAPFSKTQDADPDPEPDSHRSGETSGGSETPATAMALTSDSEADDSPPPATTPSGEGERRRALMEEPPTDDVCPICFGNFDVPCRAPCGHWYCGSCILQYWNFSGAMQPCKCPMCSLRITKLIPETSLHHRHQAEITKVLKNVSDYNRLFAGGISGFLLKFLAIPLYVKRMFREMLNADRPGVYLHEMRVVAMILGILYSFTPFDFLRIGHRNIVHVFDYSAFALSFIFYLVGVYIRWRRHRNVRELIENDMQAGQD